MNQSIRLVIADDHPIFRAGLKRLLESEPGLTVLAEASDAAEAVRLTRSATWRARRFRHA